MFHTTRKIPYIALPQMATEKCPYTALKDGV